MAQGNVIGSSSGYLNLPIDNTPIGVIQPFVGATPPNDYLICDGSAISRITYATLFTITGTMYGSGDNSTTFNIPDLRGTFIRGAGNSGKLVTSVGNAVSGQLGVYQNDKMQGHYHAAAFDNGTGALWSQSWTASRNWTPQTAVPGGASPISDGTNGVPRTGAETNPANLSLNYIIKAKNTTQVILLSSSYTSSFQGQGAPIITPQFVGQQYVDTSTGSIYAAVGTNGLYNWGFVGSGSLTSFNKDTVSGLLGWYDASDVSTITKDGGNNVTTWNDKSATNKSLVNTLAGKPVYTTNVQNGLPGIYFSGSTTGISSNAFSIASPMTMFLVVRPTGWSTGTTQNITSMPGGVMEAQKTNGATSLLLYNGATLTGGSLVNNTPYIITMIGNGGSSSIQINNNTPTTGTAGSATASYVLLGYHNSSGNYYVGYICELLIYSTNVASTNQILIQTYLNNKWGIY